MVHKKGKKKLTKLKRITEYKRKKAARKLKSETTSSSFSTSPFAEFFTTSSSALDSVSMISEPWSTVSEPSWNFQLLEKESKHSSYFLKWQTQSFSSMSASPEPIPTTSSGRPSPDISESRLTLTMFSYPGSFEDSVPVIVNHTSKSNSPVRPFEDIDGMSVWTIESYTSTGYVSRSSTGRFSRLIQVKYPWSPVTNSEVTFASDYPSSVSLLQYMKPSRDTLQTIRSTHSTDTLPYFGLGLDKEAIDSYLDWGLIERCKILY